MCKMPPISLTKAYNYCLWIVCLSTRYTISYPFRHFLCFKMTFCDVFEGYYFLKKSILLFEKSYFFLRKNVFFFACNTRFTSIFTLIAHYFNPRLQTMYWNVSIFNVPKRVGPYHICFWKMATSRKKTKHRKFDTNSVYCCSKFGPKFPIVSQFYQSFINIYSFQWKLANKNKKNIKRIQK